MVVSPSKIFSAKGTRDAFSAVKRNLSKRCCQRLLRRAFGELFESRSWALFGCCLLPRGLELLASSNGVRGGDRRTREHARCDKRRMQTHAEVGLQMSK